MRSTRETRKFPALRLVALAPPCVAVDAASRGKVADSPSGCEICDVPGQVLCGQRSVHGGRISEALRRAAAQDRVTSRLSLAAASPQVRDSKFLALAATVFPAK
jgi:hypothetical protein